MPSAPRSHFDGDRTTVDELRVVRQRIASQRLSGAGWTSAADVVRSLGAVQAQEFAEVKWSLAERIEGEPIEREIEAAFARGEIIRTHILRPTWHLVAPEDLRWMLELTAPRVQQANKHSYARLSLDQGLLSRSADVIAETLSDGVARTRKELQAALGAKGIDVAGPALAYATLYAELEALICSGPRRGKQHTYVLVEQRVGPGPKLSREEALAELTRRYFRGHGPATLRDFSWWSGLTMAAAKAGAAAVAGELVCERLDGKARWYGPSDPPAASARSGGRLIPMYDELGVAYKDLRMAYAAPPPFGVMARPILIDGLCVGSWRRTIERREVTVEATLIARLSRSQRSALEQVVERFGRFCELPARLRTRAA